MNLKQREAQKAKRENEKIAVGDSVIITNRFFNNHGIPYRDLGVGTVTRIVVPTEKQLPKITIKFSKLLIAVHPLYVEKIIIKKVKKHAKKEI